MTSKITNSILLALLSLTSLSLSFLLLRPNAVNPNVIISADSSDKTSTIDAENKIKATFFNVYPNIVIPSDDKSIDASITLLSSDGKRHTLNELVNKRSKLIFRYSELDCDMCIDSVISIIKKISPLKKIPNLIIISDFKSDRNFQIREKYKKHPYPIYNISSANLGLPIENKNFPFLFIITEDLKATKLFIPLKEFPYQTIEYIKYAFSLLKISN
jgi:hypothetical protein